MPKQRRQYKNKSAICDATLSARYTPRLRVVQAYQKGIEDLADLDRLDDAFTRLAEQQHTFEQSIAKDREQSQQELRQLVARVKALKERIGGTIMREQRGYIYQMVQLWGAARARIERRTTSETMSACWGALKARYRLAKYDQLPIHLYDDCVQYV